MLTTNSPVVTAQSCVDALPTIRPRTYDCIQSNLALFANAAHGAGAGLRMGAHLLVRPRPLGDGLFTVDPEPATEVSRCSRLLDLTADAGCVPVPPGELKDAVPEGVCYAIGDAFDMPWLPYFGQAHMPHSFLVQASAGSSALVVDAYDNQTEWGAASPGAWQISWSDLSFPARLWTWHVTDQTLAINSRVDRHGVDHYLAAFRTHPDRARAWDQLAVETWLLARRHRLFALAHEADPGLGPTAGEAAARWERLASDAFLGLRRVRRGRPEAVEVITETHRLLTLPLPV